MSDVAFKPNPRTGRLDVVSVGGAPVVDNSRYHKVMSRLAAHRGKWWADTTGTFGSRLHEVQNLRRRTPSDLEAFAREALAPLVAAGEILPPKGATQIAVQVEYFNRAVGSARIFVGWSIPGGDDQQARYPLRF